MTKPITVRDVLFLHQCVQEKYPSVISGHVGSQKIDSIIAKTFMSIRGQPVYNTIFKQAASLMEGIIRFHPFLDGNKRTALLVTYSFLFRNKHYMVMPLDTIRFMTNIAQNTDNTDKDIEELNDKIAAWLKARTATTRRDLQRLISKHLVKPALGLLLMSFTGIGIIYVRRKFRYWFVIDTHPEYDRGLWQTLEFLLRMTLTTTKRLTQK